MGPDRFRLGYRPALDGLRAVAVAAVFAAHAGVPPFEFDGYMGVEVFLVLSGFLITSLMIEEAGTHGRVSLSAFYRRRALRILPASTVLLVAVTVWLRVRNPAALRDTVLPALTYTANIPREAGVHMGLLEHMWSLSLEEQFYLLWPITFVCVGAAQVRARPVWMAAAGLSIVRLTAPDGWWQAAADADALLVGCALSCMFYEGRVWRPSRGTLLVTAAIFTVAVIGTSTEGGSVSRELTETAVVWACLPLVAWAVLASPRALQWRGLTWSGRRPYAMYLWHVPLLALDPWGLDVPASVAVYGTITLLVAEASWLVVEAPAARLRRTGDRPLRAAVSGPLRGER